MQERKARRLSVLHGGTVWQDLPTPPSPSPHRHASWLARLLCRVGLSEWPRPFFARVSFAAPISGPNLVPETGPISGPVFGTVSGPDSGPEIGPGFYPMSGPFSGPRAREISGSLQPVSGSDAAICAVPFRHRMCSNWLELSVKARELLRAEETHILPPPRSAFPGGNWCRIVGTNRGHPLGQNGDHFPAHFLGRIPAQNLVPNLVPEIGPAPDVHGRNECSPGRPGQRSTCRVRGRDR